MFSRPPTTSQSSVRSEKAAGNVLSDLVRAPLPSSLGVCARARTHTLGSRHGVSVLYQPILGEPSPSLFLTVLCETVSLDSYAPVEIFALWSFANRGVEGPARRPCGQSFPRMWCMKQTIV